MPQQSNTITERLAALRQALTDSFNESELQTLCFDLGVDYEILRGQGKADKARELVSYFRHRGKLRELVAACQKQRPNIAWQDIIGPEDIALDIPRLMQTLSQSLPPDDPAPQYLMETLNRFQYFHTALAEWKELHNLLNDIVYAMDQFSREVERLDASGQKGDPRMLARLWRPVAQKTTLLLDWAATILRIAPPLVKLPEGGMRGPTWAVEIQTARTRIDEILQPGSFDLTALYDATYAYVDAAERHMYLADKQLRETVGELYNLSSIVLESMPHDQV